MKIRKLKRYALGIGMVTILFLIFYYTVVKVTTEEKESYNIYRIQAEFNDDLMRLKCSQTIEYINNEKEPIDKLFFHLYPNAFKDAERIPIPEDEMALAYPNGFAEGSITIQKVNINGRSVPYIINENEQTIMNIPLPGFLKPGQKADIFFQYTVKLPPCQNRFGYGPNSINVTNWYPILCVYDENGWHKDPYYPIGDPFYSDVAHYEVSIIVPTGYTVAHTGKQIDRKTYESRDRYEITAQQVRDFAWFASKSYELIENRVGHTDIKSYSFSANGMKALEMATKALKTFNKLFGEYPYESLSVAESDFYVGGMEYPQIVQIDSSTYKIAKASDNKHHYNPDGLWLEYLIAHEIAHQWWYGIVGSNEIKEPWLDEGLTEYSTILYFENNDGIQKRNMVMENFILDHIESYKAMHWTEDVINQPIHQFDTWKEYSVLVYSEGAMVHHELRNKIGDDKYLKLLRRYYDIYKYRNASIRDFINIAEQVSKQDLKTFFEKKLGRLDRIGD